MANIYRANVVHTPTGLPEVAEALYVSADTPALAFDALKTALEVAGTVQTIDTPIEIGPVYAGTGNTVFIWDSEVLTGADTHSTTRQRVSVSDTEAEALTAVEAQEVIDGNTVVGVARITKDPLTNDPLDGSTILLDGIYLLSLAPGVSGVLSAGGGPATLFELEGDNADQFNVTADEDPPINTGVYAGRIRAAGQVAGLRFWRGFIDDPIVIPAGGFEFNFTSFYNPGNFSSNWAIAFLAENKIDALDFLQQPALAGDKFLLRVTNGTLRFHSITAGVASEHDAVVQPTIVDVLYNVKVTPSGIGWQIVVVQDPLGAATEIMNEIRDPAPPNLGVHFGVEVGGQDFSAANRPANIGPLVILPL